MIAAANKDIASLIRSYVPVFPTGLHQVTGQSDAVIRWADLCLAVSGTVSIDIARARTPMVGVYRTGPISFLLSKAVLRAPFRLLPNVIADREIVPEFVPYVGGPQPIVSAARNILSDSKVAAQQ